MSLIAGRSSQAKKDLISDIGDSPSEDSTSIEAGSQSRSQLSPCLGHNRPPLQWQEPRPWSGSSSRKVEARASTSQRTLMMQSLSLQENAKILDCILLAGKSIPLSGGSRIFPGNAFPKDNRRTIERCWVVLQKINRQHTEGCSYGAGITSGSDPGRQGRSDGYGSCSGTSTGSTPKRLLASMALST